MSIHIHIILVINKVKNHLTLAATDVIFWASNHYEQFKMKMHGASLMEKQVAQKINFRKTHFVFLINQRNRIAPQNFLVSHLQVDMKNKYILSIIILLIMFNGCIPVLRSSKGLEKGQMQISYNAPVAGDIRYGISDNTEFRYSIIGESFETDLMCHFHKSFDYSFAIGTQWLPDWEGDGLRIIPNKPKHQTIGLSLNASKEYWKRINPYVGFSSSIRMNENREMFMFFATGIEMTLLKRNLYPINLVITPELIYIPGGTGGDFDYTFFGSCGIGLSFDLMKIFK